jgi:hypothetical protein
MRSWVGHCWVFLGIVSICGSALAAEPSPSHPVKNIYVVRFGEQLNEPHIVTYRMVEWAQKRGRWIFPDIGYKDTGYARDQLWFVAGGAQVVHKDQFGWTQELYFTQEAGAESHNKRSMWIWPVVDARFPHRLTSQIVPFSTIPLDRAQRWGFDVDRARLEWAASSRWITGAGYSGGICKQRTWQSRPFISLKRRTSMGDVDLWAQRIPDGAQLQVRWMLVRDER